MKKLFPILLFITSCADTSHEVRYSPNGKDSVVYVKYFDGQQFVTFYMNYAPFKLVYDEEGYEGCYYYYRDHQLPAEKLRAYSKYKRK